MGLVGQSWGEYPYKARQKGERFLKTEMVIQFMRFIGILTIGIVVYTFLYTNALPALSNLAYN